MIARHLELAADVVTWVEADARFELAAPPVAQPRRAPPPGR